MKVTCWYFKKYEWANGTGPKKMEAGVFCFLILGQWDKSKIHVARDFSILGQWDRSKKDAGMIFFILSIWANGTGLKYMKPGFFCLFNLGQWDRPKEHVPS